MAHVTDRPRRGWTPAGRCIIFVCDIVGFGDPNRVDHIQCHLREELYTRLRRAFDDSDTPFDDCYLEDRGDGAIVIPPPDASIATLLSSMIERLDAELRRQNQVASPIACLRLRAALHAGEIYPDDHGIAGTAVNHAFRILEGPGFKQRVKDSSARLSVIVSAQVYDDVVRHAMGLLDPAVYQPIDIESKETKTTGWMRQLGLRTELAEVPKTGQDPAVPTWPGDQPGIDARIDGNPILDLSPDELSEIVELLLDIPLMATERGRDQVVDALRDDIARMISRQPQARLDTHCIVQTCRDHAGGLPELLAAIRRFVGRSTSLLRVEQIVTRGLR